MTVGAHGLLSGKPHSNCNHRCNYWSHTKYGSRYIDTAALRERFLDLCPCGLMPDPKKKKRTSRAVLALHHAGLHWECVMTRQPRPGVTPSEGSRV